MSLFEAFWPLKRLFSTSLACRPDPCASFGIDNIEVWSTLELGTDLQSLAIFRKIGPKDLAYTPMMLKINASMAKVSQKVTCLKKVFFTG